MDHEISNLSILLKCNIKFLGFFVASAMMSIQRIVHYQAHQGCFGSGTDTIGHITSQIITKMILKL